MSRKRQMTTLLVCASALVAPMADAQNDARPQQAAATVVPADPQTAQAPQRPARRTGNSLLRASLVSQRDPSHAPLSTVSFFSVPEPEPRVIRKHDLITIIVREESEFSSEATTETNKEASIDAGIEQWLKLDIDNWQLTGDGIGASPPRIAADGTREFSGEGTVERSDSFVTRIQAQVIDVKPNGTVVIEAKKEITTDDEFQRLVLSGTCRAEDVTADNTVLSTQLHDLNVRKSHKGNVRNASRKGWIPKLLDAIDPF